MVVPDLEQIAKLYLFALEKSVSGDSEWQQNYEWMMLELYDQFVRQESGGEMGKFLQQLSQSIEQFVRQRIGSSALADARKSCDGRMAKSSVCHGEQSVAKAIRRGWRLITSPRFLRNWLIRILSAEEFQLLETARFQNRGEVHRWMYDRYSLASLLAQAGFAQPAQCSFNSSRIGQWQQFRLDSENDETSYKPDSLFMEAVSP